MPVQKKNLKLTRKIVLQTIVITLLTLASACGLFFLGFYFGSRQTFQKQTLKNKTLPVSPSPRAVGKEVPYGDENLEEDADYQQTMQALTDEGLKPLNKNLKVEGYHHDFTFSYPDDWQVVVNNQEFATQLTISQEGYQIIIAQGDAGAAACLYPGDPEYETFMGPNIQLANYVEFEGEEEMFRRSEYPQAGNYLICGREKGTDGFGSYLISAGFTKYETPLNPSPALLRQMDRILMSIKVNGG